MPPWHYPESIKARVIALRDEYERIFVRLIDHLPPRSDIDKHYLRLTMIGALSWDYGDTLLNPRDLRYRVDEEVESKILDRQ